MKIRYAVDQTNRVLQYRTIEHLDALAAEINRPATTPYRNSNSVSAIMIIFNQNVDDIQPLIAYVLGGCGWPQHMLLPKGTETGLKYDIFVMVSDYERDRVDPEPTR